MTNQRQRLKGYLRSIDLLFDSRPEQKKILKLWIDGYSQVEIVKKLWKSKQNVSELLKISKKKCQEYFLLD